MEPLDTDSPYWDRYWESVSGKGNARMRAKALFTATAAMSVLAGVSSVHAQTIAGTGSVGPGVGEMFKRDRNVSVRNHSRPGYEALGVRVGGFYALPKVTATASYDDNIYAKATAKETDLIGALIGEVTAGSTWSRHSVNFYGRIERDQYKDHTDESRTTYVVGGSGQIDVNQDFAINGGARYNHSTELRTASGAPSTVRTPVQFGLTTVNLSAAKAFNRLRLSASYELDNFHYQDTVDFLGNPLPQSYRNRNTHSWAARADYAVSPDTAVFFQVSGDARNYEVRPPNPASNGLDRNSSGYELSVGADFQLAALMRGQLRAGYLKHSFADPTLPGVTGLGARADVEWYPTELTTVAVYGGREVKDTGLRNSPTSLSTTAGIQVDHELLRNVILTGKYDYSHDVFDGIDRTDQRNAVSAGAVYLLNHRVGLSLLYTLLKQNSEGVNQGPLYTVNRVSASLVVQY